MVSIRVLTKREFLAMYRVPVKRFKGVLARLKKLGLAIGQTRFGYVFFDERQVNKELGRHQKLDSTRASG